jgi:CubicO group peptidase (beta-lactamase class C family)
MRQAFAGILMLIMLTACATPRPEIGPFSQSLTLEQNIKGAIAPFVETSGPGGVVLVADDSGVIVDHTFGNARLSPDAPITATTPFYLASVSKQFTSTAVMLLVERGALSVDDPISDFFPEAPEDWKAVTVHHLLTHTSGLETYYRRALDKKRAPINNQRVVSWALTNVRPAQAPGTRFSYSNTGYVLLAEIIARISGVPIEQFMLSEIFQPAGMNNTIAAAQFDDFPKGRAMADFFQPPPIC